MHTLGPWSVALMLGLPTVVSRVTGERVADVICEKRKRDENLSELEANASLIAAAPELIEACRALLDISGFGDDPVTASIHRQAEAAIAKAEGRLVNASREVK